jgi:hypothetical protein
MLKRLTGVIILVLSPAILILSLVFTIVFIPLAALAAGIEAIAGEMNREFIYLARNVSREWTAILTVGFNFAKGK